MAIGIPEDVFGTLNPHKLKLYYQAYEKRMVNDDRQMWMMGQYVMNAFSVVMANSFGKGNSAKYIEKPILESAYEQKQQEEVFANMSEEEKRKQTEKLFMQLNIIGKNFNLSHGKGVE